MLKLPSYLQQNKYGFFYFRMKIPKRYTIYLSYREFKRSLRTRDRKVAISLARRFLLKLENLYNLIEEKQMNYIEARQELKDISNQVFMEYTKTEPVRTPLSSGSFSSRVKPYPSIGG